MNKKFGSRRSEVVTLVIASKTLGQGLEKILSIIYELILLTVFAARSEYQMQYLCINNNIITKHSANIKKYPFHHIQLNVTSRSFMRRMLHVDAD